MARSGSAGFFPGSSQTCASVASRRARNDWGSVFSAISAAGIQRCRGVPFVPDSRMLRRGPSMVSRRATREASLGTSGAASWGGPSLTIAKPGSAGSSCGPAPSGAGAVGCPSDVSIRASSRAPTLQRGSWLLPGVCHCSSWLQPVSMAATSSAAAAHVGLGQTRTNRAAVIEAPRPPHANSSCPPLDGLAMALLRRDDCLDPFEPLIRRPTPRQTDAAHPRTCNPARGG